MPRARKKSLTTPLTRRWRAALAHAGMKQAEWARQYGWTDSHVSQVVAGKRESEHVTSKVLAFIGAQEQEIAERVAAEKAA